MLLVGLMTFGIVGCGPKVPPNTSPEGIAAIKGRAVVNTARAAVQIIDQQMTAGRIPPAAGVKVLQAIRQVYVQAGNLANALDLVDQAKTAADGQSGLLAAKAALGAIHEALQSGIYGLDPGVTKSILELLANLVQVIDEARAVVGEGPMNLRAIPGTA